MCSVDFRVTIKDDIRNQTAKDLVSQALALTSKVTPVLSGGESSRCYCGGVAGNGFPPPVCSSLCFRLPGGSQET